MLRFYPLRGFQTFPLTPLSRGSAHFLSVCSVELYKNRAQTEKVSRGDPLLLHGFPQIDSGGV